MDQSSPGALCFLPSSWTAKSRTVTAGQALLDVVGSNGGFRNYHTKFPDGAVELHHRIGHNLRIR
jgi:hypothetical protein